jgi:hypothetical protein
MRRWLGGLAHFLSTEARVEAKHWWIEMDDQSSAVAIGLQRLLGCERPHVCDHHIQRGEDHRFDTSWSGITIFELSPPTGNIGLGGFVLRVSPSLPNLKIRGDPIVGFGQEADPILFGSSCEASGDERFSEGAASTLHGILAEQFS